MYFNGGKADFSRNRMNEHIEICMTYKYQRCFKHNKMYPNRSYAIIMVYITL